MKTVNRIFGLVVVLILLFSVASTTHGFRVYEHLGAFGRNTLIRKVHAEEWKVGYRFREGCPDFYREKEERLQELIAETLNVWLQPLRDAYPQVAFTEKFVFVRQADSKEVDEEVAEKGLKEYHRELNEVDMRVNFWCLPGNSTASLYEESSPQANMRDGLVISKREFIHALVHEIGHTFGLADTYVSPKAPEATRSTGGLAATSGKQPSSVMGYLFTMREPLIMEDDKRGIVWLYKHIHEGQALDDCFFPRIRLRGRSAGLSAEISDDLRDQIRHAAFEVRDGLPRPGRGQRAGRARSQCAALCGAERRCRIRRVFASSCVC